MTELQQIHQCEGPHRPTVKEMIEFLSRVPSHLEIRAISIHGQCGGRVYVETYYEEHMETFEFERYHMELIPHQ